MSQVTIYLEPETLEAAKAAAARAQISVSKWFAQFAESERSSASTNRAQFWAEVDRLRANDDGGADFLLNPLTRYQGLGNDLPRESAD